MNFPTWCVDRFSTVRRFLRFEIHVIYLREDTGQEHSVPLEEWRDMVGKHAREDQPVRWHSDMALDLVSNIRPG